MNPKLSVTQRRYDLDWLRVLAILTVFIFHSGRFFDTMGWHVKNPTTYDAVDVWTSFLANWMMPLIFVISGASLYFALGKGSAGRFVKDKVLRLFVPLVVGIFTHIALQVYLERISHGQFRGTFFEFVPHYFDGLYGFGGNFAWMGLHLWYLLILFVFSIALYPLFRWLKAGSGARALAGVNHFLALPGMVYLLALPIMLLLLAIDPRSPLGDRSWGGWGLAPYLFFFVYGFVIIAGDRVQQTIQRQRWVSLAAGAALVVALAVLMSAYDDPAFGTQAYAAIYALFGLCSWCWVVAILGFGMRHLNFNTPVPAIRQRGCAAVLRVAPDGIAGRGLLRGAMANTGCAEVRDHRGRLVRHHPGAVRGIDPALQCAAVPVRHEAAAACG